MSSIPDLVLTNAGATLLAKTPIGSPIPVTKWQIGTGVLSDETNLRTRTKLVSVFTEVPISRVEPNGKECLVTGTYINKGFGAFTWSETGLFAQDPDVGEILYAYGNSGSSGGAPIPAGSAQYREIEFGVQLVFDVSANVTASISQSLIYATRADLQTKADLTDGQVPYAQTPHLIKNATLYVDAALGSDANPGTQEAPFKTIQAAVNSLPRDLGTSSVNIYVADGSYQEDVFINGFTGGTGYRPFVLKSASGSNTGVEIQSVSINNCSTTVRMQDLSFIGGLQETTSTVGISSARVELVNLMVKKAGNKTTGISVGANGFSQANISGCVVDGYDEGISSIRASVASVVATTVKNCAAGLKCYSSGGYAGIIMAHNMTYQNNTANTQSGYNGQIFGGE